MVHFHDVDILLKLAACNLLDDLHALLEVKASEVQVLETAIYKIRSLGKKGCYLEEIVSRAIAFCEAHSPIPQLAQTEIVQELASLGHGMDAGEVILFASALNNPESRVVTGDKRAMRLLGKLGKENVLVSGLKGRVICFEELLLRYLDSHGYESLRARCHEGGEQDGVLRLAFRAGLATEQGEALEGIHSAWRVLNRETSEILVARSVPPLGRER
jgi:hypothetical protein